MFQNHKITDEIFYVGVNDRQKHKFENMLALPYGISYNSYLIIDEKTALIDTVEITFGDVFIGKIQAQLHGRKLDYLVINHMEPDHSGSIRLLRKFFPEMTIIGNNKTLHMIEGYYQVDDNVMEVKDGDELILGKHRLQFFFTPMVHWPETMMTYEHTNKVLFSGDAFGCFGNLDGAVVDIHLNVDKYWDEMIRYYANIVGKYGAPVQKALQKLTPLDFNFICSTHGPVWHKNISEVVDVYDKLSRYDAAEGVVIIYGSMYGNTELMAETVAQGVAQAGIKNIMVHNVSKSDSSDIIRDIFKYNGVIIGSPTYCNELYPEVESVLRKIEIRAVKHRYVGYFGSFTWAGAAIKRIESFVETMKWISPDFAVEEKHALKADNYEGCLYLGKKVGEMVKTRIEPVEHCK
jgi:anaerobic nitric oxide reductase flavorubredoxin